jgi:dolichol-phosphate mannosyltransferase
MTKNVDRPRADSLVVIPTYNEVGNLEALVRQVLAMAAFDVLVVDDHSLDGTGEVANELARQYSGRVMVLHRLGKQGLGSAYIQGFAYARSAGYERIFQTDADFFHDPGRLPALRDALDHAELVLGSRYVSDGSTRHWPLRRRFLSRAGSVYAAAVLGLPFRDVTSGFKAFTRQVLEALDFYTIRSSGYSFQIEVTCRCYQRGFHIVEVPITFEDRRLGKSKMSGQIVTEALLMVWRLSFDRPRQGRKLPWPGPSGVAQ